MWLWRDRAPNAHGLCLPFVCIAHGRPHKSPAVSVPVERLVVGGGTVAVKRSGFWSDRPEFERTLSHTGV